MAKADADAEAQRIADEAAAAAALQALADAAAACTDGTQACVDANQAYVDALDADDANLAAAQAALAAVQMAKAEADQAEADRMAAEAAAAARQALVDAAAACTDGTQACIDANQALVDALTADETTLAVELAAAEAALAEVQSAKAEADAEAARMAAEAAAAAARQALVDAATCSDATQACVDAHQALVDELDADPSTTADDLAAAQAALALVQAAKTAADDAEAARLAAEEAERMRLAALADLANEADCTDGTAACVAAHQALVDALEADDTTSEADLTAAKAALSTVQMAKAEADAEAERQRLAMEAAEARQMLVDAAAGCTDGTQACVDAHDALIAALQGDLDALEADPDSTNAQLTAARLALAGATSVRDGVQLALDEATAAANAAAARQALVDAAMCMDGTEACVASHQALVDALQADLDAVNANPDATNAEVDAAEMALADATTARDTVQTALDDANAATMQAGTVDDAITAAMTAVNALTDESDADAVQAARDLVMAAQTALDGADKLSSDDVATEQARINGLDTSVGTHETRLADAQMEADRMAATAAAATKREAIEAEAAVAAADDEGLGSNTDAINEAGAEGAYTLAISWDDETDAQSVTITVEGATDAADVKFEDAMAGLDGGRHMLTREHDAGTDGSVMTEVAIVATDLEAPMPVKFAEFAVVAADGTRTMPQELDGYDLDDAVDADGDGTATNDWTALNIVGGNIGMVKADAFTAPDGTVGTTVLSFQHMVADDASTTDVDESRDAAQIAGTFNGAMGIYRCNAAAACTVTVNTMGVVSAVSTDDDWVFIPAADATSLQPDYDYYHYGFWLKRTADDDGAITYNEVQTFAGSRIVASTGSELDTVRGSASYEGGAVGVYVRETYDAEDGSVDTATSGHFSADASLTATFGQIHEGDNPSDTGEPGTIAPNMLNTVTGRIHNFELQHGEANTWVVHLDGTRASGANTFSGSAKGGGAVDGEFSGTFHGLTPETTVDTDGNRRDAPGSMVGEFDANFGNGTVAGAFGARKQ